jgi:DNA-binding MarR family transcriptional regulator
LVAADNYLGITLLVSTKEGGVMSIASAVAPSTGPSSGPDLTSGAGREQTHELMNAVRSLFTCTRKVRSWVSDAGPMTVLGVVAELGEARVSTVATTLLMDVSTVSRSLSALCKDGLVQWRADESDHRSHLVSCTAPGLARLDERRTEIAAEFDRRLENWTESDLTELSRLLHRFVASVLLEPGSATAPLPPSTAKESA